MLRALCSDGEDVFATVDAMRTLVRRQDPLSLQAVIDVLRDHPFWGVRLEAAKALEKAPGPKSQEALIDAVVEDGDPRVRRTAIRALASFKEDAEEIAEILIRHVESETSDYAIADSVRTIAELRTPAGAAFVRDAVGLVGHNHCIRAAAIESLARLRDVAGLETALSFSGPEQHTKVREAAVEAIGKLAAFAAEGSVARADAKEALIRLLGDPWLRVRIRAAEALVHLGDRGAIAALEEHANRELDGRARRAMRIAARDLKGKSVPREELDRINGELEGLRRAHAELLDRLAKLEQQKKDKKKRKKEARKAKG
jgi:aminopeptidase N